MIVVGYGILDSDTPNENEIWNGGNTSKRLFGNLDTARAYGQETAGTSRCFKAEYEDPVDVTSQRQNFDFGIVVWVTYVKRYKVIKRQA